MSLPTTTRAMARRADVPPANVWPLDLRGIFLEPSHQLLADGTSALRRSRQQGSAKFPPIDNIAEDIRMSEPPPLSLFATSRETPLVARYRFA